MAGPQNGIMGVEYPTELPETQVDETALNELKNTARFSKTKEFKELKEHFERRIEFYQQYLPNGAAVGAEQDVAKVGQMWVAANVIIGELKAVIEAYEQAAQMVKDESTRRKGA